MDTLPYYLKFFNTFLILFPKNILIQRRKDFSKIDFILAFSICSGIMKLS